MATTNWKYARGAQGGGRWRGVSRWAAGLRRRAGADSPAGGDHAPLQAHARRRRLATHPQPEEEAGPAGQGRSTAPTAASSPDARDANGRPLRLFFNTSPTAAYVVPDVWAYYKDGVEVYREFESETKAYAGKPDQYRWLNGAGGKWGVDEAKDGHIKGWKVISPEEVSQELLMALAAKDFARLQALMITDAEMTQLGLPADEVTSHPSTPRKPLPISSKRPSTTWPKLAGGKPNWVHLETAAPECTPAEQIGAPRRRDQVPARLDPVRDRRRHRLGADRRDDPGRLRGLRASSDAPTAGAAAVVDQGGPPDPNKLGRRPQGDGPGQGAD